MIFCWEKSLHEVYAEIFLAVNTNELYPLRIIGLNQDNRADGQGMAGLTFLFQKAIYQDTPLDFLNNDFSWVTSNLRRFLNDYNGWHGFSKNIRDTVVQVEKRSIKDSTSAWLKEGETNYVDTQDRFFILDVAEFMDPGRGIGQGVGENKDECYLGANGLGSAAIQSLKGSWCRGTAGTAHGWIVNVGNVGWTSAFSNAHPFFPAFCF